MALEKAQLALESTRRYHNGLVGEAVTSLLVAEYAVIGQHHGLAAQFEAAIQVEQAAVEQHVSEGVLDPVFYGHKHRHCCCWAFSRLGRAGQGFSDKRVWIWRAPCAAFFANRRVRR